jgi:hypothetical protein
MQRASFIVGAVLGLAGCAESHTVEPPPVVTCVPDSPMPRCNTVDDAGFCINPIVRPPVTDACEWGPCPEGTIPTETCPRLGGDRPRPDAGR